MKIFRYPSPEAEKKLRAIENRSIGFRKKDVTAVARIIDDVKKNGDDALLDYTRRFDAPKLQREQLVVSREEMAAAPKKVDRAFVKALNRACRQIKHFHRQQRTSSWINVEREGTLLGQVVRPVDAAGVYVPGGKGGKTPLVSTVLMGAIPANIAGVGKICMVTPPMRDGGVDPHLLVAARKAGVDEVYKVGSAWAVAALAYGTQTVPRANVIVGPGNIYVTLAKKLVAGEVGIDMIAGPSEILVIADDSANPAYIAADLLSQAEHDPLSSAVLVTTSRETAGAVSAELKTQLTALARHETAAASLQRYGALMVVPDIGTAVDFANRIAPEHLELQIKDPLSRIALIRNAGAIFLGDYTPEPVGDYMAGPNHVLPTAGTARYASALSVDHFMKKSSIIQYSKDAFRKEAADVMRLAEVEGLGAHANAVRIRLK
ncbi:MAG: histidinol dehydrogenase [Deltaproteobacteria bacterium]|nr:histidinol dehydrogenase [Deltaproteobacteria bacterium]